MAQRAGIDVRVSAEVLRQAHIADLAASGWSVRRIQTHLGHAAPSSTRRLLSRIAPALKGRDAHADPPQSPSWMADASATEIERSPGASRVMLDAVDVAALALDDATAVVGFNRAALAMSGMQPGDLLGRRLPLAMLPGLGPAQVALRAGASAFQLEGRAPGDHAFPALVTVARTPDDAPWSGHVATIENLSRQLAPLRRLRASREAYRSVVENAPDAILRFDRDLRVSYANAGMSHIIAGPPTALMGHHLDEGVAPPELAAALEREVANVLASEDPRRFEFVGQGGSRRIEWRLQPELAPDGHLSHVLCFGRDVTEAHRAGEALARTALDQTMQARALIDAGERPGPACRALAAQIGDAVGARAVVVVTEPGEVAAIWGSRPGDDAGRMSREIMSASRRATGGARTAPRVVAGPIPGVVGRDGALAVTPLGPAPTDGTLLVAFAGRTSVGPALAARLAAFARTCAGVIRVTGLHRRVEALEAAAGTLMRLSPPDAFREAILADAGALAGGEGGLLVEPVDDRAGAIVATWAREDLPSPSPIGTTLSRTGRCAAARCLDTGRSAWLDDVGTVEDPQNRRLSLGGFHSALAVPLTLDAGTVGVLCVVSVRRSAFRARDRRRLEDFAGALTAA